MAPSRPRVVIEYCTQCRWLLRAAWMAQELLTTFQDELGEVALHEAALASLRLLAGAAEDSGQSGDELPPRRAVLVADVGDVTLRPDLDDAVVRIGAPVTSDDVVAAFVDNAAAEGQVKAAIAVIDAADLGDEDAELTVGDAQDHDLAWYAVQELPFLLELL